MLWELTDINKILVCEHKTLTMLSLTPGSISSALCSRILCIPVASECRIVHNLGTYFYHTLSFLGCKWIDFQEESLWYSITFLTSGPVCSFKYLPKSVRKHTNDCVQQNIKTYGRGYFCSHKRLWSLGSYYALPSDRLWLEFRGQLVHQFWANLLFPKRRQRIKEKTA
jgi:hypothetical protein